MRIRGEVGAHGKELGRRVSARDDDRSLSERSAHEEHGFAAALGLDEISGISRPLTEKFMLLVLARMG